MYWIDILFISIIAIIVAGMLAFMVYIIIASIYCHTFTALRHINGKVQVYITKARLSKCRKKWHLWDIKLTKVIPHPPADAIEIGKKGKMYASGYLDSNGEILGWEKHTAEPNMCKLNTETFTTEQRQFYADELKRDANLNEKSWKEVIITIIPWVLITAIVFGFLVFGGEIYAKHTEMLDTYSSISQTQQEITESLGKTFVNVVAVKEGKQIIEDRKTINGVKPD